MMYRCPRRNLTLSRRSVAVLRGFLSDNLQPDETACDAVIALCFLCKGDPFAFANLELARQITGADIPKGNPHNNQQQLGHANPKIEQVKTFFAITRMMELDNARGVLGAAGGEARLRALAVRWCRLTSG